MKVLVVGGGGREHALAWRLSKSESVTEVIGAPGNPGIARIGRCEPVEATDPVAVANLAETLGVDLVVVGPEGPLVAGVSDECRERGILTFGPSAAAAELEGSKAFAKSVMDRAGVPTAAAQSFTLVEPALEFLDKMTPPYVIKADGLAAGKGVTVAETLEVARDAVSDCLGGRFGDAGASVLIEEFLDGEEASLFCITDGTRMIPLVGAQDFKRAHDGDRGPNTGGMGAYSPVTHLSDGIVAAVEEICQPVVDQMAKDGNVFQGLLYAGLMIDASGAPRTVEFNCRFGDPETQVVLPRLEGDFGLLLASAARGDLEVEQLSYSAEACVTVVLASGGYPGRYETGLPITGIQEAESDSRVVVFHAGTALRDGELVTAGGRVLAISAMGANVAEARAHAYEAAAKIDFEGKMLRSDIAADR